MLIFALIRKRVFHVMSGARNLLFWFFVLRLVKLDGLALTNYGILPPTLKHSILVSLVVSELRVKFLENGLVLLTKVLLVALEFRLHTWWLTEVIR